MCDTLYRLLSLSIQSATCHELREGDRTGGVFEKLLVVLHQADDPDEKAECSLHALIRPFQVLLRWRGKQAEQAGRIGPVLGQKIVGIDDVFLGFRHLLCPPDLDRAAAFTAAAIGRDLLRQAKSMLRATVCFLTNHPLGQKLSKGFIDADQAKVAHHLREEASIQQVKHAVLHLRKYQEESTKVSIVSV